MQVLLFEARGIPHIHIGPGFANRSLPMKSGQDVPSYVGGFQPTNTTCKCSSSKPGGFHTPLRCVWNDCVALLGEVWVAPHGARSAKRSLPQKRDKMCLRVPVASSQQIQHASAAL
jgi:hypothetical protein